MQFHDFVTNYDVIKKHGAVPPGVRPLQWQRMNEPTMGNPWVVAQTRIECDWMVDARPYYSVYPVIAESLAEVKLTVPCELVKPPLPSLLIRFAKDQEAMVGNNKLRSFLMSDVQVKLKGRQQRGLAIYADFGERMTMGGFLNYPVYSYLTMSLEGQQTVEDSFSNLEFVDSNCNPDEFKGVLQFAVAVCLLGNDPDIIEPDVLSKDRAKWEESNDVKIVERAHRRGKKGWLVGARIVASPHFRRPHFGLRWTGEGRAIPKIVPIKGAIVHRKKFTQVPTGRLDLERCKVCGVTIEQGRFVCKKCDQIEQDSYTGPIEGENTHYGYRQLKARSHRVVRSTKPES